MRDKLLKFNVILATLVIFFSTEILLPTQVSAATDSEWLNTVGYPFTSGQNWCVVQGYNTGSTHNSNSNERYALDLSTDIANPPSASTAGKLIYAAADGYASPTFDLTANEGYAGKGFRLYKSSTLTGYSLKYGHLDSVGLNPKIGTNQLIKKGEVLGKIYSANSAGGWYHLHFGIEYFNGSVYSPIELKYGVWNLPSNGSTQNQYYGSCFNSNENYLWTLHNNIPVPADYDGDGKADLSIKTSDGRWLINYSNDGLSDGWDLQLNGYGGTDAIPLPGHYNGHTKADISIKGRDGRWLIDYSYNGFGSWDNIYNGYGDINAVPVPADYDGDGTTDLSVKDNSGNWLINFKSNGFTNGWDRTYAGYGDNTSILIPYIYDNDKKTDISLITSTGRWLINYANNGLYTGWDKSFDGYGGPAEKAVPGNYDTDGITDLSLLTTDGRWLINFSSDGLTDGWDRQYTQYGDSTVYPVPADYDGDKRTDFAIKTKDGRWLINFAKDGFESGWNVTYTGYGD